MTIGVVSGIIQTKRHNYGHGHGGGDCYHIDRCKVGCLIIDNWTGLTMVGGTTTLWGGWWCCILEQTQLPRLHSHPHRCKLRPPYNALTNSLSWNSASWISRHSTYIISIALLQLKIQRVSASCISSPHANITSLPAPGP